MESYVCISYINDFLYCPVSIYLHSLFLNFDKSVYQQTPQIVGTMNHEAIDDGTYSSAKRFITSMEVYSSEYGLVGKLDIYDSKEKSIIERKTHIKSLHKGYRFQLYAQYFCLLEMGYEVKKLFLHSLKDNRRYSMPLPGIEETKEFAKIIKDIKNFDIKDMKNHSCFYCESSIYEPLIW